MAIKLDVGKSLQGRPRPLPWAKFLVYGAICLR